MGGSEEQLIGKQPATLTFLVKSNFSLFHRITLGWGECGVIRESSHPTSAAVFLSRVGGIIGLCRWS